MRGARPLCEAIERLHDLDLQRCAHEPLAGRIRARRVNLVAYGSPAFAKQIVAGEM
jgi:hypothetical protein